MSNSAKKSRTNRFGVTAPVRLRSDAPSKNETGFIDREQQTAVAEAEQHQGPLDDAEAMVEAQRMVEKHQQAFDLLR